jgi:Mg-chelatase subunit ChlD
VSLIGDASGVPQVITGDKLASFDTLIDIGKHYNLEAIQPIQTSHPLLLKKVQSIEEGGPTSLGPALVLAAGIASQKPRSEIIVCTDGISNVGVGSLDDKSKEAEGYEVYKKIGAFAKANETSISVIGIEGSEGGCALKAIGACADMTAGTVR